MERASTASTASTKVSAGICLAVLAWCVWRAAVLPIGAGEARLYNHLVRLPIVEAVAQPDAWAGLLYAVAARRTVHLLRLSEFTLRLPAVLSALLYLWIVYRLSRKHLLLLALAAFPAMTTVFVTAQGGGLATALCLAALTMSNWNFAGLSLGLALAAAPGWWWMPSAAALGILAVSREWIRWVQQVAITAIAAAFVILLIPLVHAGRGESGAGGPPAAVRTALKTLRRNAGARRVSIAVSAPFEEQVLFYRARYRATSWDLVGAGMASADYYVLDAVGDRRGHILFRDPSLILLAAGQ
jgi:hypothetical protein